ncbi:uncharacterized protein YALI1_E36309g [Yarrowia lipolytica]|uniref:Uncharacterized protein n=1 Tax=Yarrowia lipolytica TaxID=4952 RepID=A0A1D8NKN7_YARLL|nr:hypothetical protein YALI1_E36309g [Yarrowia lipolytica]
MDLRSLPLLDDFDHYDFRSWLYCTRTPVLLVPTPVKARTIERQLKTHKSLSTSKHPHATTNTQALIYSNKTVKCWT